MQLNHISLSVNSLNSNSFSFFFFSSIWTLGRFTISKPAYIQPLFFFFKHFFLTAGNKVAKKVLVILPGEQFQHPSIIHFEVGWTSVTTARACKRKCCGENWAFASTLFLFFCISSACCTSCMDAVLKIPTLGSGVIPHPNPRDPTPMQKLFTLQRALCHSPSVESYNKKKRDSTSRPVIATGGVEVDVYTSWLIVHAVISA